MSRSTNTSAARRVRPSPDGERSGPEGRSPSRPAPVMAAVLAAAALSACGGASSSTAPSSTTPSTSPAATSPPVTTPVPTTSPDRHGGGHVDVDLLHDAYLGAAPFQDVVAAEEAGWVNTVESLGCFENAEEGGMGVHWLNESLLDAELNAAEPEALVYELDAAGEVVGLVGHEYLVPFEAWTAAEPPRLFGLDLHEHPVLPFWILHAYLWKDNPNGMFSDWNPAVRMCPEGVDVFGVDLP